MSLRRSNFLISSILSVSCSGAQEPEQVELPVMADASELGPVTTDLGYEVEVTEAKAVVDEVTFAIAGEVLTRRLLPHVYDWAVPSAHAHPGHHSGGDITGELRGHLVFDWLASEQQPLGMATLLEGSYTSANLVFSSATQDDQLGKAEEMVGHSVLLSGVATIHDERTRFTALVQLSDGDALVGVPFEFEVDASTNETLYLQLKTFDETEGDTLFDGLDFRALDDDGDRSIRITPNGSSKREIDAYLTLSRALRTHDNYRIVTKRNGTTHFKEEHD